MANPQQHYVAQLLIDAGPIAIIAMATKNELKNLKKGDFVSLHGKPIIRKFRSEAENVPGLKDVKKED